MLSARVQTGGGGEKPRPTPKPGAKPKPSEDSRAQPEPPKAGAKPKPSEARGSKSKPSKAAREKRQSAPKKGTVRERLLRTFKAIGGRSGRPAPRESVASALLAEVPEPRAKFVPRTPRAAARSPERDAPPRKRAQADAKPRKRSAAKSPDARVTARTGRKKPLTEEAIVEEAIAKVLRPPKRGASRRSRATLPAPSPDRDANFLLILPPHYRKPDAEAQRLLAQVPPPHPHNFVMTTTAVSTAARKGKRPGFDVRMLAWLLGGYNDRQFFGAPVQVRVDLSASTRPSLPAGPRSLSGPR